MQYYTSEKNLLCFLHTAEKLRHYLRQQDIPFVLVSPLQLLQEHKKSSVSFVALQCVLPIESRLKTSHILSILVNYTNPLYKLFFLVTSSPPLRCWAEGKPSYFKLYKGSILQIGSVSCKSLDISPLIRSFLKFQNLDLPPHAQMSNLCSCGSASIQDDSFISEFFCYQHLE